jgi:bacillithiol synthase
MLSTAHRIPYQQTNHFTKIVTDYLAGATSLRPFYHHPPTLEGIRQALEARQKHKTNRKVLVEVLQQQYHRVDSTEAVAQNIEALSQEQTFTVCTAHQPNLFTGPVFFIYKILHTIKLAGYLKEQFPSYQFVPVYYMGSEDADLDELNHIYLQGRKYEWTTRQTGAVGRMVIDKGLTSLISEMEGQLSVEPFGNEFIALLRDCYTEGATIQEATFKIVHRLFGAYGLVVLIPDHPDLKREMRVVFNDDLYQQQPSRIVQQTSGQLNQHYNTQAYPREINLFYLKDNIRERIIRQGDGFVVNNTDIRFSEEDLDKELAGHPERFSPNVILRGLFQETILPNLVFIGGGGELAYWLQLRALFDHYKVPYPVLVLRNSFLLMEKKWKDLTDKLGLSQEQLFLPEQQILDAILEREGKKPLLNGELAELAGIYDQLRQMAMGVDSTLTRHVEALKTKATNQLLTLEKKMVRAERKKHEVQANQINKLKAGLFPGGLQERMENIGSFYAQWGSEVIHKLYEHSLTLEQEFTILMDRG